MKLAFADREAYYGDPRHVDGARRRACSTPPTRPARRALFDPDRAWPAMPPPGDPAGAAGARPGTFAAAAAAGSPAALGTSYVAVVDRAGNAFSATPSDVSTDTPVVPGTGLAVSSRGSQGWLDPEHASAVAPGKRPRLTPSPAMVFGPRGDVTAFGTPGGDVQVQAMLQVLLNLCVFDMSPQRAIEAPRFATQSFPRLVLAPPLLPGPAYPRRAPRRVDRGGAPRPWPRGAALGRLGVAGGRRVPGADRRGWHPLGRRGPAPRFLGAGMVKGAAVPDWRRRTLRAPARRPFRRLARVGRILALLLSTTGCAVEAPRPTVTPPREASPGALALLPPPILSRFGEWRGEGGTAGPARHAGIDIRAAGGTPVLAAADGVVLRTGWQAFAGRRIVIGHDADIVTVYYHLSAIKVVAGQAVRRGDVIGRVGHERQRDRAPFALRALPARGRALQ